MLTKTDYSTQKFLLLLWGILLHTQLVLGNANFNSTEMQQHFFVESTYQDTTTFTDIDAQLIGGFFSSVVWGDYDNDGDLDLLVNGSTDNDSMYAKVYRNDAGLFVDINAPLVGAQSAHAESWVDFDNDDDLDLIIQGATGPNNYQPITKIYRNDNGNFVDINAGLPGVVYGSTSWGDYDHDGDLDLLLTGSPNGGGSFISRVYRNNNGSFVNINAGLPGVWGSSSAWVDYDNDGDLDISLTGYGDWGVTNLLFRNDDGVFTVVDAQFARANSGAMAWGDYDNDGDLDFLYTGLLAGAGKTFTTIYRNDNGNFIDIKPGLVNVMASAVAWGDYNNDGWLDILISGATKFHYGLNKLSTRDLVAALYKGNGPYITDPVTKIYYNNGRTFSELNVLLPGLHNCAVGWGDYDNDGDLDIALTGGTSQTTQFRPYLPITKIFRNNGGTNVYTQNAKPSVPEGLKAEIQQQTIILTWNRSTDDHTPQNGLIYNLRLGTTNSGVQRFSPISNISTGFQRVPKMANAHKQNQWEIKNLPPGTYYWSVQAIDKSYAGSLFAEEQTFTIGGSEDTLKYFSFIPESLASAAQNKIPKAEKKKNVASYWEFVLKNKGTTAVTEMHIQFKQDVDFARGLENTKFSAVTQETKKKYKFSNGEIPAGDSVIVKGYCVKAKPQQIKKYWFGPVTGTPAINMLPSFQQFLLPMPNYTNVIEEIFREGGFGPTNGLLVGKILSNPQSGGWVLMKKADDVLKSLRDKSGLHTQGPRYFDKLKGNKNFTREQKTLPPDKHNNKLFAELTAFKLGIAASALGITKPGFGDLKYIDPGNPLHDNSLIQIALLADHALTNRVGDINNLYYVIRRINNALTGPLDTVSFASRITLNGSKLLSEVPFLKEDPLATITRITPQLNNDIDLPSVFNLHQNYPNPFNPSTTIRFTLAEQSVVTLKVYNLLGQEVTTLINKEELDEGEQTIDFVADNLSSGVYFYKITVDGGRYQEIKKMVLLR